jgi:chromosome segregation ATPase
MKLHTEMHTPTDIEIAKQLEELWHTIERGITIANQATKQAADIHTAIIQDNSKIEQLKLDTFLFSQSVKKNIQEIQEQQTKLEFNINTIYQIRDEVASYLEQIGDYQILLDTFRQGLKLVIESVDATKIQAQQLEGILPAFTKDLPQQLEQINQLAAQIETNKQEVARYQEKIQLQTNEVSQTHTQIQSLKTEVETIITNFGGKQALDKLHQDNQNIHNHLQQAQIKIERLNQKLETQAKKQKQANNWLLALTVCSALTLILSIIH